MSKKIKESRSKKIFFLAGLPRAGNTILASILNQNPDVCCTPNSITLEIYKDLFLLKQTDIFQNFPDHKSLDNVLSSVFDNYYKDWNYKYIIDRGPAGTALNLNLVKKHLDPNIKIIFLVRPILEVLASWVAWGKRTPDSWMRKFSVSEACHQLMNKDGQIVKELRCMENLLKSENKHHVHFVNYDEIIDQPKETMEGIYKFLGIPKFKHRFKNLKQVKVNGIKYNDSVFGKGMHTIKTRSLTKTKRDIKKVLPKEIIEAYGSIQFV